MVRFATIGTNFITDWFLEAAKMCEGMVYAAAYSRDEERAKDYARKNGAQQYYTDLHELAVAKDIDAVYIASPNGKHCEQAVLMMKHGKHVLCEKAIASNRRELDCMIDTATSHNVVLLEAMRPAFDPGLAAVESHLHKLGIIRRVSFQYGKYSSRYDNFKAGILENAFNPLLANGALMDIGVYCIYPLVRLFQSPIRIQADAVMLSGGIDGAGSILASYPEMQAELLYSKITDNRLDSQIQGEEGTMIIKGFPNPVSLVLYDRKGKTEEILIKKESNNMVYEIREWKRLIEGGMQGESHHAYSVMAMDVMDKVRKQIGLMFPADTDI